MGASRLSKVGALVDQVCFVRLATRNLGGINPRRVLRPACYLLIKIVCRISECSKDDDLAIARFGQVAAHLSAITSRRLCSVASRSALSFRASSSSATSLLLLPSRSCRQRCCAYPCL